MTAILQPRDGSGFDCLAGHTRGADRLDVAAAFVTRSGVELLASLLPIGTARLICRAGHGPTDPAAVEEANNLGFEVRLVTGAAARTFHPKIYVVAGPGGVFVLTGSGNLTSGGLKDNVEQFEAIELASFSSQAVEHEKRFNDIWAMGLDFEVVRASPYWDQWVAQRLELDAVARLADESEARLDRVAYETAASRDQRRTVAGDDKQWTKEQVYPLIAAIITERSGGSFRWVSRHEIAETLLSDPVGSELVATAKEGGAMRPPIGIAGNMVDWLSAEFEGSEYSRQFERSRQRVGGSRAVWAYRVRGD